MAIREKDFLEEEKIYQTLRENLEKNIAYEKDRMHSAAETVKMIDSVDEDAKWMRASEGYQTGASAQEHISNYEKIKWDPYFGRFSLQIETDHGKTEQQYVYIGKHYHHWQDKTIVSWADESSPEKKSILNAFYSKSLKPFTAGNNRYEIQLKRNIKFENGILSRVDTEFDEREDTGITVVERVDGTTTKIYDPYLLYVLRNNRNKKQIQTIIATLQEKQNVILRQPPDSNLIVQGCPGSGKTQVLFHRLAYFREGNKPIDWSKVQVISPGTHLRRQVQPLTRELQIADIPQNTLEEIYLRELSRYDLKYGKEPYCIKGEADLPQKYLERIYADFAVRRLVEKCYEYILKIVRRMENRGHIKQRIRELNGYETFTLHEKIEKISNIIDAELNSKTIEKLEMALVERERLSKRICDEREALSSVNDEIAHIDREIEKIAKYDLAELNRYKNEVVVLQRQLDEENELFKARQGDAAEKLKEGQQLIQRYREMKEEGQEEAFWTQLHERGRKTVPSISALQKAVQSFSLGGFQYEQHSQKVSLLRRKQAEILLEFRICFETKEKTPDDYEAKKHSEMRGLLAQKKALAARLETVEKLEKRLSVFDQEIAQLQKTAITVEARNALRNMRRELNGLATKTYEDIVREQLLNERSRSGVMVPSKVAGEKTLNILYRHDLYYLLQIYSMIYGFKTNSAGMQLFIDEGQSISKGDYDLLFEIYPEATFNIYGDVGQCLVPETGIVDWEVLGDKFKIFNLTENLRNTRQVVQYTNHELITNMIASGLDDGKVIMLDEGRISALMQNQECSDFAVIIASKNEYTEVKELLRSINVPLRLMSETESEVNKHELAVYTVKEACGMEFQQAIICRKNMTKNMKYVAYTRALNSLYLI